MATISTSSFSSIPLFAVLVLLGSVGSAFGACYSHFFSFGDSLIDTGNFIHYSTAPGSVSHLPYGETFFHYPTGRWSNGRLVVDFMVDALKIPHWIPYLDGKTAQDFQYGVNFAVASGTAEPQRVFAENGLNVSTITPYSLGVQIGWFKKVLNMLGSTDQERKEIMSTSLFLVGEIGENDYNHPFFQNKPYSLVKRLMPQIIKDIGNAVEVLIKLGAKILYVPGIFPMGCSPRQLFFFLSNKTEDYDSLGCLKWLNNLAKRHNNALKAELEQLRKLYPDVSISYVDYYGATIEITTNPLTYGLDKSKVLYACCGGGGPYNANLTITCSNPASILCPDPSKYISWDGLHYTEAIYQILANDILDGPYANPPILSKCKN